MLRVPKLGLVPRFALLSFALIALVGVVVGRSINADVRARNIASAKQTAILVSRLGVQPMLSAAILRDGLSEQDFAALDETLDHEALRRAVVRIKIWNNQGVVVYSDDPRIVDRKFPIGDGLGEALDGNVEAEITALDKPENALEHETGTALEVYVPIEFERTSDPAGAFEIYLPFAPIASAINADTRNLYLLLAGGLGFLWLALFRIVRAASRRFGSQVAENRYQALHDSLTELPNRVLFRERVEQAILLAGRSRTGLAVMLMDLDRFKEVNDTLGHHTGDLLLRKIGPRLRQRVRGSDTVARLGGDEFSVLLQGVTHADAAIELATKLLETLEQPFTLDQLTVEVEASVGIALYPEHGDTAEALLQHADVAMYVAKEAHSGAEVYMPQHDLYSRDRLTLIGELRGAIERDELVLHYQPKVDLRTGRAVGVEGLLRWNHPTRGFLFPDEFIPAAEHTGLIRPLTSYVLSRAATQCARWRKAGYDLTVAVNLSARNLQDVSLPEEVGRVLTSALLTPDALKLEITESGIMVDPVRALAIARRLRGIGVALSIDDFGTGYSSLSYLREFPVEEIKIDKSFVIDMTRDENDAAIVRSTIGLAQNLGLTSVAEGVETAAVQARLAELGCDLAQGYFICRPLPPTELTHWLQINAAKHVKSPVLL